VVWLPRLRELRAVRAREGITVAELAAKIGRSNTQVQKVLTGHQTQNTIAEAVAAHFGLPIEELFQKVDLENPDEATAA